MSLATSDAAAAKIQALLETQTLDMQRAGARVAAAKTAVERDFQAICSATYQQRISRWEERFRQLERAYQTFRENLSAGNQMINAAHEEAVTLSTGGLGDDITTVLNGGLPR